MIEREIIEELKKQLKEEVKAELISEMKRTKYIKVLCRDDIQKLFNCGKTRMNQIMHSNDKPPVVYIGGEYYSTEKQMKEYFNSKDKYKKNKKSVTRYSWNKDDDVELHVLHKEDLMGMFKMGRTKFKIFIDNEQSPIKILGTECYVTSQKLEEWFDKFEGKKIDIDYSETTTED
ncbi:MAG: hypothetical protein E6845_07945 [Clostridium sp.]|uniref:hypothetical protein n=1 Tax=Clostridium TaxID=1485 RepID=UPI002903A8A2|nr:hypothetical protein [Clostridium sp.]MDU1602883.1 hypothetical protein [Clostridium sp.]